YGHHFTVELGEAISEPIQLRNCSKFTYPLWQEYVRPYSDEVINDKYWAPHPQTGVFGPATDHSGFKTTPASATVDSVLEHKAFFRPLEDLDKPAYV
ncbi:PREDICTED: uncharacterized protein LOC109223277, partial [Nicotiana attenuata]|uniref:uncharacterized protein LOC109223277 n=1 Tax=Nicotiana attenuata TaxID=49451 RepID=UPI0009050820